MGGLCGQLAKGKLIGILARLDSTGVNLACKALRRQVYDKLAAFFNYIMRKSLGAHRNICTGRLGSYDSRPSDGQHIWLVQTAARNQRGGQRSQYCTGIPGYLCHKNYLIIFIINNRQCGRSKVSLRVGHAAGLTSHRDVIQHRVAASLPCPTFYFTFC